MSKIMVNQIRTPDGTVIKSRSVHDYNTYIDANGKYYSVDGGLEYLRRGWDPDAPPYEDVSIYSTDPHEVIREHLDWGSFGKDGKEELHYILLKDMNDNHIAAVLETQKRMHPNLREAMENEQKYRREHGIVVPE
jgi:hypothetical protein